MNVFTIPSLSHLCMSFPSKKECSVAHMLWMTTDRYVYGNVKSIPGSGRTIFHRGHKERENNR